MIDTWVRLLTDEGFLRLIVNVLVGVTAIAVLTLAIVSCLGHRSARLRQAVLYIGIAGILVSPALTGIWTWCDVGLFWTAAYDGAIDSQSVAEPRTLGGESAALERGEATQVGIDEARSEAAVEPDRSEVFDVVSGAEFLALVLLLWCGGIGVVGVRIGAGHSALGRLRRSSRPVLDERVLAAVRDGMAHLRMTKNPELRESSRVTAPLSFGIRRPTIVFPAGFSNMEVHCVKGVVLHELAHIDQRHGLARVLQNAATSVFWWHPLVLWLDRWLRAIQEEVCDQVVVGEQGSGVGFARCLVEFAEAAERQPWPRVATGMFSFGGSLERRVQKLLSEESETMKGITRIGAVGLALFTVAGGALHAGLNIVRHGPDQDKTKPKEAGMHDYFPLATGATWKWRFQQTPGGEPTEKTLRCERMVKAGGRACWELRSVQGSYRSWEYWSTTADGIFQFKNRYLGGMRGVSSRGVTRLVPGPFGAETRWKWSEIGSVQTAGGSSPPSADELRMEFEGRIESVSEAVEVPAGKFDAAKIVITMQSRFYGKTEQTIWFARGVGMVKRVDKNPATGRANEYELLKFTPGTVARSTAREQIAALLADPKFGPEAGRKIRALEVKTLEPLVSSRFYVASWSKPIPRRIFFRDDGVRTSIFNPVSERSWRDMIRGEVATLGRRDAIGLTKAYGVLLGAYAGLTEIEVRRTEVAYKSEDDFDALARIRGKDAGGTRVQGWVQMWFKSGTLKKMMTDMVQTEEVEAPRRR